MNDNRTGSILQRVAAILAVTAASYGLSAQAQEAHSTSRNAKKASSFTQEQNAQTFCRA